VVVVVELVATHMEALGQAEAEEELQEAKTGQLLTLLVDQVEVQVGKATTHMEK
jgi:hypothetical protein